MREGRREGEEEERREGGKRKGGGLAGRDMTGG
jgi:hypothetical protein